MMRITVFTPTYNRAYILDKLYCSLRRQSFHDFEWLIVDDGSTDRTQTLVNQWSKEECTFSIRYLKQPNGGKCRAINRGLDEALGELFLVVDSDDILTEDALEKIDRWERELPSNDHYCGVAGNLGTAPDNTGNRLFDKGFYDGTLLDRYKCIDGERAMAFYTEIHQQYKYPVFDGETFMTEAVAYNRMAHDGYKMRFYNDIICVYEYLEDGLTKAGNRLFLRNPKGYGLWLREKEQFSEAHGTRLFRLWYMFYCEMSFCEEPYRLPPKKIAEYIGAPIWAIYAAAALHAIKTKLKG